MNLVQDPKATINAGLRHSQPATAAAAIERVLNAAHKPDLQQLSHTFQEGCCLWHRCQALLHLLHVALQQQANSVSHHLMQVRPQAAFGMGTPSMLRQSSRTCWQAGASRHTHPHTCTTEGQAGLCSGAISASTCVMPYCQGLARPLVEP